MTTLRAEEEESIIIAQEWALTRSKIQPFRSMSSEPVVSQEKEL